MLALNIQNCNKVNISKITVQTIPIISIQNVSEVVFHEDSKHINLGVDRFVIWQFSMTKSIVNLIPDGLFKDSNYFEILFKNCTIKSIGSGAFHNLTVNTLNIDETKINQVNSNAFRDVEAVQVFIQNSRIVRVKSDALHFKHYNLSSIIKLQDSSFGFLESNAFCNVSMKDITIDDYKNLALSYCNATNKQTYEKVVLSKECNCDMYKIVSLKHEHKFIDIESRSLNKAIAEKKILDNLYCLLEDHHYSWTEFDTEHCKHGLSEKITEVVTGNYQDTRCPRPEFTVRKGYTTYLL